MKKELIIEMEEECIDCPKLSLTTESVYWDDGDFAKVHKCKHLDFCKAVRKNWEKVKEAKKNETD